MSDQAVAISSSCCAICGFTTENTFVIIAGAALFLLIHIYVLIKIALNCRRRDKAAKLNHERRLRRAYNNSTTGTSPNSP